MTDKAFFARIADIIKRRADLKELHRLAHKYQMVVTPVKPGFTTTDVHGETLYGE